MNRQKGSLDGLRRQLFAEGVLKAGRLADMRQQCSAVLREYKKKTAGRRRHEAIEDFTEHNLVRRTRSLGRLHLDMKIPCHQTCYRLAESRILVTGESLFQKMQLRYVNPNTLRQELTFWQPEYGSADPNLLYLRQRLMHQHR